MIALILAAGRGSRLRELTADKPKCLVELAGKPLLRWQYDALRQAGTERILVVRGYLAQRLTPAAIGLEPDAFENVENPCWAKSNMLSSLLCAATWLDEAFGRGEDNVVISYSDIVYPAEHIRALATAPEDMAITYDECWEELWRLRFGDPLLDAETFCQKDGLLRDIGGKPESMANIQGQYMGLMLLRPHGWERLKKICAELGDAVPRMDLTGFLQHLLSRNIRIGVVPVRGHWCEVDSQEDMRCYQQAMNAGNWTHDWRPPSLTNRNRTMEHGDFTSLADKYARYRPAYAPFVLDAFLALACRNWQSTAHCADVGAGTGIWSRQVAARGIRVSAVEPNDAMREAGEKQSVGLNIVWSKGSAENTGLPAASCDMVCMASSFHWPNFDAAVREFSRILKPGGLFMALWNTRCYESNPLLAEIEGFLHKLVPDMKRVSSGRSEFCDNLAERLRRRKEFSDVLYLEGHHTELQSPEHYIGLWESVNDVRVQAGEERFARFIEHIRHVTRNVSAIEAEYRTRAWIARRRD